MILVTHEMVREFFRDENRNVDQINEWVRRINEERSDWKVRELLGVLVKLDVSDEERNLTLQEWGVVSQFIKRLDMSDRDLLLLIINALDGGN